MTKNDRQSRLAAALRENLKRRKRQTRERVREAQADHHEVVLPHTSASDALNPALQDLQDSGHHDGQQENMNLKGTD